MKEKSEGRKKRKKAKAIDPDEDEMECFSIVELEWQDEFLLRRQQENNQRIRTTTPSNPVHFVIIDNDTEPLYIYFIGRKESDSDHKCVVKFGK